MVELFENLSLFVKADFYRRAINFQKKVWFKIIFDTQKDLNIEHRNLYSYGKMIKVTISKKINSM